MSSSLLLRMSTSTEALLTTNFFAVGMGEQNQGSTNVTRAETVFYSAGTLSNLTAHFAAGNRPNASLTLRVNNVNTSYKVDAAIGTVTNTGSYAINAGDRVCLAGNNGTSVTGAVTWAMSSHSMIWTPDDDSVTETHFASGQSDAFGLAAADTRYTGFGTRYTSLMNTTAEALLVSMPIHLPPNVDHVTVKNLHFSCGSNTMTGNATVEVIGATGSGTAPAITVAAGTATSSTAVTFENTTDSIQAKDGDNLCLKWTFTSGGNLTVYTIGIDVVDDSGTGTWFLFSAGHPTNATILTAATTPSFTDYCSIAGGRYTRDVESVTAVPLGFSTLLGYPEACVVGSGPSPDRTDFLDIGLRVNNADTDWLLSAQNQSYTNSTTYFVTDELFYPVQDADVLCWAVRRPYDLGVSWNISHLSFLYRLSMTCQNGPTTDTSQVIAY